jgi:large subunit ribosomal protein L4
MQTAKFKIYNLEGQAVDEIDQPNLFQTPVDEKLIHRYFVWVRNMLRPTISNTKTRGEVSGGGKKPWKQKGTGRARVGSSRSPIWRKGGIVFGPLKEQTFATRMPRSERRKALFSALAAKAIDNQILILESWEMTTPKTKEAIKVRANLSLNDKKVLHLHAEFSPNLFLSTQNIPNFNSKTVQNMNIIDILNHDSIIMTKDTLNSLDQHFTPSI